MSTQLRTMGRHTMVYTAGIIIGKVASFVMLPVYTRYLTPAEYGVLELLSMTIDVIGMIAGIGLVAGVFKFYSAEEDPADKNAVFSTAVVGVVFLATVTTLIGQAVAPELTKLVFGSAANLLYLRLYFLLFFLQNLEYVPFLFIRAENRSVLFVTINALKLVALLSLNIFFVVHLRLGIKGVLASSIITTSASGFGLTFYLLRRTGIGFSIEKFRRMVKFGSPMILWSVAMFIMVFSDRFFLNHYSDTSTVGIYSLAYKFAFLLSALAYGPFQMMWDVQRFEIAKRPDAVEIYTRIFLYMNLVLGGMGLLLCLFVKDFLSVMSDHAFLPAYRLVPLLIAAQVLFSWAGYWNLGLYVSSRTQIMAGGAVVLVPLTLLLNYLLIPQFGIYGAAWATLAAYAARFLWIYHFSQRYYPIEYRWSGIVRLYAIFTIAVALRFGYRPEHLPASIGWSVGLLLASICVTYSLVLSPNDRSTLRTFIWKSLLVRRRAGNSV